MNRPLLLAFCLAAFHVSITAQDTRRYVKDSTSLRQVDDLLMVLDSNARSESSTALPFSRISLADVRFDTSHVGLYAAFVPFIRTLKNYRITFDGGLRQHVEYYLNHYFEPNMENGTGELVCFVKRLRMVRRDSLVENVHYRKQLGRIHFQTEVFYRSGDTYYAVFKIDTVLTEMMSVRKSEYAEEMRDGLVMPALALLQQKILTVEWTAVTRKKPFTEQLVFDNYYKTRFNLPILKEPYRTGIYLTQQEFINNRPSIPGYRITVDRQGVLTMTDKNGRFINTLNIFGFSNGNRCWIQRGNYYYPFVRHGNCFEFFYQISLTARVLGVFDPEPSPI